jgi:hypothetical protein
VAKLLVHGRDRAQILVRARRALDEPEVEGVSTSPQAGILGATIKLASLPAAFAALYRAHDVSPDLASALLDMNSAAFVSTWATWALLLGAAGAVTVRAEPATA